MKIGTFGMLNNPEYRQEPWRESIAQKLLCFDVVCLVCGNKGDIAMLKAQFPEAYGTKLLPVYREWPFPEWSYEQLPQHLNEALELARFSGCQWAVRLDVDTVVHERDIAELRHAIAEADRAGKWLAAVQKMQFFMPTKYYEKGKMPLCVNLQKPVAYGFDTTRYTDLCQPIEWDGKTKLFFNGKHYDVPVGTAVSEEKVLQVSKVKLFNYDHTFRTQERATELLYEIECAHARFWGQGYNKKQLHEITRESAMADFIGLSLGRYQRMQLSMEIGKHPKHFQAILSGLQYPQWGFALWGKAVV